jgi:hypothetical protein
VLDQSWHELFEVAAASKRTSVEYSIASGSWADPARDVGSCETSRMAVGESGEAFELLEC